MRNDLTLNELSRDDLIDIIRQYSARIRDLQQSTPRPVRSSPIGWLYVRRGKVKVFMRQEACVLVDGHYPLFGQSADDPERHIPAVDERFLVPKVHVEVDDAMTTHQPTGGGNAD